MIPLTCYAQHAMHVHAHTQHAHQAPSCHTGGCPQTLHVTCSDKDRTCTENYLKPLALDPSGPPPVPDMHCIQDKSDSKFGLSQNLNNHHAVCQPHNSGHRVQSHQCDTAAWHR